MEFTDRIQGEFNSALEYLTRISRAFEMCNEASASMNGNLWIQGLTIVFKELSTKMKPEELLKRMDDLKEITNSVTSYKGRHNATITSEIYWKLFNFELYLRRVFAEAGLEMKVKPDVNRILFKGGQ